MGEGEGGAAPGAPAPQRSPILSLMASAHFNPHGGPGEAGAAVIGTAPAGK